MELARKTHRQPSFSSARTIGGLPELTIEEPTLVTKLSGAIAEEAWSVMTWVLVTFFATVLIAFTLGTVFGVHCFPKLFGKRARDSVVSRTTDVKNAGNTDIEMAE